MKQFIIPFAGLKDGGHNYQYLINDEFFTHFPHKYYSEDLKQIHIKLDLMLSKDFSMLNLGFNFSGTVKVLCDRCAEWFILPVEQHQILYVKFGTENFDNSEDILVVPMDEGEIDISQYIYEFITLALPMRKTHPEGKCNKNVLMQLKKISNGERNPVGIDPRWAALEKLKSKK